MGQAFHLIRDGFSDAMITGGVESTITTLAIAGFNAMRALSTRNDDPLHASRPFDKERDGFILSEGSGLLIVEELNFARARGAKIYAELIGFGASETPTTWPPRRPKAKGPHGACKWPWTMRA